MLENKNIGLVWLTQNLRVKDNRLFRKALQSHDIVVACYCFDPRHFEMDDFGFVKTDKFRAKFLIESVQDLKDNLQKMNIELFVYAEQPENVLPKLVEDFHIHHIYKLNEWTDKEMEVYEAVEKALKPHHVIINSYFDQFLIHPNEVQEQLEKIPKGFTSFRTKVEKYCHVQDILTYHWQSEKVQIENTTQIPTLEDLGFEDFEVHPNSAFPFKGGETAALNRLEDYFFNSKNVLEYKQTRNGLVGLDYSTKLSSWLANGSISPRTIYWKLKEFEGQIKKNESTYWIVFELLWRDFFKYISIQHKNQIFFRRGIKKSNQLTHENEIMIQKWIHGQTEDDFVNANMLELKQTGWISNRGRQNVASYFAKTLQQDWRVGAAYFESMLIDYDVDNNYGNWIYLAGVGNDPRDRVFNTQLQAERYDGNRKYRDLWLNN